MPLDLKAVVAEKIALDKKDLAERLAAANRRQKEAERGLAERRLLLRYVAEEVEKDQTLVPVWDALSLADVLNDGNKILMDKENANPTSCAGGTAGRPSLLGLSPPQVLPSEIEVKEFQAIVIPRVALRMENDRDFVVKFCRPNPDSAPTSQPFTSVSPLCDAVEGLLTRLAKEKRLLREEEEKKEALFLNLMNLYDDLLTNVLLWFRESLPITSQEQVLLLRQHLSRIECLNKKAKLTHLDLLKDIYTPDKLSALKTVRYSLDKKKTEVESEFSKWSSAAHRYDDAVEPLFLKVAEEYKDVLAKIDSHNYILKEYGAE